MIVGARQPVLQLLGDLLLRLHVMKKCGAKVPPK
jgi:hypothetical protein